MHSVKRDSILLAISFLACSFAAAACPLCQSGDGYTQETISAYKGITLLLALLPIIGAGGIFTWIYRRQKAANLLADADTSTQH